MTVSRARATVDEQREYGRKVATYLRTNPGCFIEQAAMAAGILPRKHHRWMDGEDEGCEAYQAEVFPALLEHAKAMQEKAEADIASCEAGSSAWANWHKWLLEKRFRKLYGDLATKVELSGPGGGPLLTANVDATDEQAMEALKLAAKRNPRLAGELKKLGSGE